MANCPALPGTVLKPEWSRANLAYSSRTGGRLELGLEGGGRAMQASEDCIPCRGPTDGGPTDMLLCLPAGRPRISCHLGFRERLRLWV